VTVPGKGDSLSVVLEKVPAEAVMSIVDLVVGVVRANKIMEGREQEFQHTVAKLRETNLDRKERMAMLAGLLRELDLKEEPQLRLIESICRIAEGV
jgi:hypothetical protein